MPSDKKIPASIGILTLNSGKTLRRALESVKDFAEIIVCDGNSADNTLALAREYGAKIIKQYDSDEPNLRCEKDKANVRNRNMRGASFDWYFFMDSDDELKLEVALEICAIVENPNPPFLIYKMPARIFLDGKLIKHASVYPAYQTRLFSRETGAYFKGPVHERIIFDKNRYRVGLMKNYYDFHWPKERIQNFWTYQKKYAQWEVDTVGLGTFAGFLYWAVWRRLRIILGFVFWKIPRLYLIHGFKDSLPPRYELLVLGQHFYILYLFAKKAFLYGIRSEKGRN